jgi:hypothetical protein
MQKPRIVCYNVCKFETPMSTLTSWSLNLQILNARKGMGSGWSEPAATSAPVQDEVVKLFWG